ncbi:MAG: hypothetical protein CVT86_01335 [Alphaproteobacteria bacterium HGW-Alphaproteobacteria-8]|jgi:hypothetical protein|nr:MAG: hypothetical protein CVT86_01335 [Alphaproteobacteria bacterium HGW-Alphaproteobacteria-8]
MPPRRKIDQLPEELRARIKEALRARGFAGYDELTAEINEWLEAEGLEITLGKSAVHSFGQEYEEFVKLQDEAGAWARDWVSENDVSDDAERQRVLFKMMTTIAFKVLKAQAKKEGDEIDPRELHFLGRMMKDVMQSSGIREQLMVKERARIVAEERAEAAAQLDSGVATGRIDAAAAQAAREVMGLA